MTEEHKTFKIARRAREEKSVTIDLVWEDVDGEEHVEIFTAWPSRVPQISSLRVTTVGSSGDLSAVFDVFEKAMAETPEEARKRAEANREAVAEGRPIAPPEYQRFFDFCEHPDHMIDAATLVEIMQYLIEQSTGFPTEPSRL